MTLPSRQSKAAFTVRCAACSPEVCPDPKMTLYIHPTLSSASSSASFAHGRTESFAPLCSSLLIASAHLRA